MTTDQIRATIRIETARLAPALYEGLAGAIAAADARFKGLEHRKYPQLRPLAVRAELREFLESEAQLPPGWQVTGNPALMCQLMLESRASGLRLRFLKERRRTYPDGVPVAGTSAARRQQWLQPLLVSDQAAVRGRAVAELLLLWDYRIVEDRRDGFSLRVVHPMEPGMYGRAVRCDVDFAIEAGGSLFENLNFAGDHDPVNFFDVEVDLTELGEGDG